LREREATITFKIKPLLVLKQRATMAIAAADVAPRQWHRYLRRFVYVSFERHAPSEQSFHVYLNPPNPASRAYPGASDHPLPLTRMTTTCAVLDTNGGSGLMLFAEIAFPPLGYVIIFRDEAGRVPTQVKDMPDISFFGRYRCNETAFVPLRLPVRIPVGPTPGHYLKP
jgi:hypothetical protein